MAQARQSPTSRRNEVAREGVSRGAWRRRRARHQRRDLARGASAENRPDRGIRPAGRGVRGRGALAGPAAEGAPPGVRPRRSATHRRARPRRARAGTPTGRRGGPSKSRARSPSANARSSSGLGARVRNAGPGDAESRGGGARCSRRETARALAARPPGRRARVRLCSPASRIVARPTPSLRKENESETARLPMRCRKKVARSVFGTPRTKRHRSPQRTFATRRVTPHARAPDRLRIPEHRPPLSVFITMSSPDEAGLARPEVPARSTNMVRPTKYSAESPYNDSPGTFPRLARVPERTADARLSRAPTGTGRTGMFAIPPNNYDFYTEEEKYVRGRPREDEAVASTSWLRNDTRNDARFSSTRMFLFFLVIFFLSLPKTPDARPPDLSCEGPAPHEQCPRTFTPE